jgi:hypothetical protein
MQMGRRTRKQPPTFVSPLVKHPAGWLVLLLQGDAVLKLNYPAKIEAQTSRGLLAGQPGHFSVRTSKLFRAIAKVSGVHERSAIFVP